MRKKTIIKLPALWQRISSNLLDYALITVVANLLIRISRTYTNTAYSWNPNTPTAVIRLDQGIYLLVAILYASFFLVRKGATIGKMAVQLKVIDKDTKNPVQYRQAVLRETIKNGTYVLGLFSVPIVGLLFLFANALMVLSSKDQRGIHDRIAHTQVILYRPDRSRRG